LWPKKKKENWKCVAGSGLISYFWLAPGVANKRDGILNKNMFSTEEECVRHWRMEARNEAETKNKHETKASIKKKVVIEKGTDETDYWPMEARNEGETKSESESKATSKKKPVIEKRNIETIAVAVSANLEEPHQAAIVSETDEQDDAAEYDEENANEHDSTQCTNKERDSSQAKRIDRTSVIEKRNKEKELSDDDLFDSDFLEINMWGHKEV